MSTSNEVIVTRSRVANIRESRLTFDFVNGDTAAESKTIDWDGLLEDIFVSPGTVAGVAVTTTFLITDASGRTLLSDSGIAEGAESNYQMSRPVVGNLTIAVTLSEDPSDDFQVKIELKGRQ